MKKLVYALPLTLTVMATNASAAILDFSALTIGYQGSTTLVLPEATITSFGVDIYAGAAGIAKEICAITASGDCEADMEIVFSNAVNNLSFVTSGYDAGDLIDVLVYGSSGLLGSVVHTSNGTVNLAAFSNVTRLFIDDQSTGAGFAYDGFRFDVAAVPEPATLGLIGLGLAGLGAMRRRKTA